MVASFLIFSWLLVMLFIYGSYIEYDIKKPYAKRMPCGGQLAFTVMWMGITFYVAYIIFNRFGGH